MDRLIKALGSHDAVMVVEGFGHTPEELREGNHHEAVEDLVRAAPDIECPWRHSFRKPELMKVSSSGLIMKWDRAELTAYSTAPKILDKPLAMTQLRLIRSSSPCQPYILKPCKTGTTPEHPRAMNIAALYGRSSGVRNLSTQDTIAQPVPRKEIYTMSDMFRKSLAKRIRAK
jgi:hypothetical protein